MNAERNLHHLSLPERRGWRTMTSCAGCAIDVLAHDHHAECSDCGQPVTACSDCVLSGVWLTCNPCEEREFGGVRT